MNSELEEAQAEWDAIVETQHLKLVKDEVPFEIKSLLFKRDEFLCKNILPPISSVKLYTHYNQK